MSDASRDDRERDTALFDPGLQPERTDLAWTRTVLGLLVNAALLARFARDTELAPIAYALAGGLALAGALAMAHARRLYHSRAAALRAGDPVARPRSIAVISVATSLAAFGSIALVLGAFL